MWSYERNILSHQYLEKIITKIETYLYVRVLLVLTVIRRRLALLNSPRNLKNENINYITLFTIFFQDKSRVWMAAFQQH